MRITKLRLPNKKHYRLNWQCRFRNIFIDSLNQAMFEQYLSAGQ